MSEDFYLIDDKYQVNKALVYRVQKFEKVYQIVLRNGLIFICKDCKPKPPIK